MRVVASLLFSLLTVGLVGADEGERKSPDAEKLLKDAIAHRTKLPESYAVTYRMLKVILGRDGVIESDTIYLYSERTNARYVAFGLANSRDGQFARRIWDQTLVRGLSKARREGLPTGPFKGEIVEDVDVDPKDSKTKRFLPEFDPFFFVLAQDVDFAAKRINRLFGRHLDEWYKLIEQKPAGKGQVVSDWQVNRLVVKIWFDPSQDWLPVRIDRLGLPDAMNSGERPTQSTQRIEWKKQDFGGQSVWVPVKFKRMATGNRGKLTDLVGHFRWKDTSTESVIPTIETEDWREPFRERFDEDWNWNFEDYLRDGPEKIDMEIR